MSTYATLNTLIESKIANTSETFYDTDDKVQACNDTIDELLKEYDIPEMIKTTMITFDSNGYATKPSDYYRMVKLWSSQSAGSITKFEDGTGGTVIVTSASHGLSDGDIVRIVGTTSYNGTFTVSSSAANTFKITTTWVADDATGTWAEGVQSNEYRYLETDQFDQLSTSSSYYWTEDYVPSGTRKLKVLPTDSGVLQIRYVKVASDVESTGATDSGLSDQWNEAIAYGVAMRLFQQSNRWEEAREFERLYSEKKEETFLVAKNPGGFKGNPRIKSKYERISILGGLTRGYTNNE